MLHPSLSIDTSGASQRHRPDLRERALAAGVAHLGDVELLALLLGTGDERASARELAAQLLERHGGLIGLKHASPASLTSFSGVGPVKATRVAAAIELGQRILQSAICERRESIMSFEGVCAWAEPRLVALDHEEVWILCLDSQNGLKAWRRVAQGGTHACALTVRDVLGPALRENASALVVVHNHPSGSPEPSPEDVSMTHQLSRACAVVGIPLMDHVVVARQGSVSLLERGHIR